MRLDNNSAVQRREMWSLVMEYAKSIGLDKFNDAIFEDGCDLLTPLDQRQGFRAARQYLKPGDTLVVPFVGSIAGHPRSFEKFMRHCLANDIKVHCLESRTDLTSTLGTLAPYLRLYGFWEAKLIEANESADRVSEMHTESLREVVKVAVDNAIATLKKADLVPALADAIRMGTAQAAAYVHERRPPTYREVMSRTAIEHAEKNGKAEILDRPFLSGKPSRDVGHDG
jgi:hypothetical protein